MKNTAVYAGTLSFDDLRAINAWLSEKAKPKARKRNKPSVEVLGYEYPGTAKNNKNKAEEKKVVA